MKFAWAPLAAAMGVSENQAGIILRVSGSTQQKYRSEGMSERVADSLAAKINKHPAEIWSEWLEHSERLASRPCEECGQRFIPHPNHPRQRWCSRRCRLNVWQRRKYATDPAFRQMKLTQARQHYSETADYRRRQMRDAYWAARANGDTPRPSPAT